MFMDTKLSIFTDYCIVISCPTLNQRLYDNGHYELNCTWYSCNGVSAGLIDGSILSAIISLIPESNYQVLSIIITTFAKDFDMKNPTIWPEYMVRLYKKSLFRLKSLAKGVFLILRLIFWELNLDFSFGEGYSRDQMKIISAQIFTADKSGAMAQRLRATTGQLFWVQSNWVESKQVLIKFKAKNNKI